MWKLRTSRAGVVGAKAGVAGTVIAALGLGLSLWAYLRPPDAVAPTSTVSVNSSSGSAFVIHGDQNKVIIGSPDSSPASEPRSLEAQELVYAKLGSAALAEALVGKIVEFPCILLGEWNRSFYELPGSNVSGKMFFNHRPIRYRASTVGPGWNTDSEYPSFPLYASLAAGEKLLSLPKGTKVQVTGKVSGWKDQLHKTYGVEILGVERTPL